MGTVHIALLVYRFYLFQKTVLFDLFMIKKVLEEELVIPFQEVLKLKAILILLVKIVHIEVLV